MSKRDEWRRMVAEWQGCTACKIGSMATCKVTGQGSLYATTVVVGQFPGAAEDVNGRPFTGRAGRWIRVALDKIISDHDVEYPFLMNQVLCRPVNWLGGGRDATVSEQAKCQHKMLATLRLIRPRRVLFLGAHSTMAAGVTERELPGTRCHVVPNPWFVKSWAEGECRDEAAENEYALMLWAFLTMGDDDAVAAMAGRLRKTAGGGK